jgi:hypothetical protein
MGRFSASPAQASTLSTAVVVDLDRAERRAELGRLPASCPIRCKLAALLDAHRASRA